MLAIAPIDPFKVRLFRGVGGGVEVGVGRLNRKIMSKSQLAQRAHRIDEPYCLVGRDMNFFPLETLAEDVLIWIRDREL